MPHRIRPSALAGFAVVALPSALAAHTGGVLPGGLAHAVTHWLTSPHHLAAGVGVAAVAILAVAVWQVWPRHLPRRRKTY